MTEIKQVQYEWEKYLRNRRGTSRSRMIDSLQMVLDHFKSYRKVAEFYRDECQEYLRHRFEDDGAAANTVNSEMYTALSFWYWLMERGLAEWNPWARIPKIPPRRRRKGQPHPEDCTVMTARRSWHQRSKRARAEQHNVHMSSVQPDDPHPAPAPSNDSPTATTNLSP